MRAHRIALVTVLLAPPALAKPIAANLPFNLKQIHLAMSQKELTARFRRLAPEAPDPELHLTTFDTVYFTPYTWRDCAFGVTASFNEKRLVRLDLRIESSTGTCRSEIQEELKASYGAGSQFSALFEKDFGRHLSWNTPDMDVVYDDLAHGQPTITASLHIGFRQRGRSATVHYSNPAATILSKLGPPPASTGPFQNPTQYVVAALDFTSDAEAYVMITAVDDRTAEAKTFCITSNLLRGALAREHGWGIERSREEAASNPTHVFHFSKGEALENMPENQRSPRACELIAQGYFVRSRLGHPLATGAPVLPDGNKSTP